MNAAQLAYILTRGGHPFGKRPTKADLLSWIRKLDSAIEEMFKEMLRLEKEVLRLEEGAPKPESLPSNPMDWCFVDGIEDGPDMRLCTRGIFELWVVPEFPADYPFKEKGWWIRVLGQSMSDRHGEFYGPETGEEGKAKALAAWKRASGSAS